MAIYTYKTVTGPVEIDIVPCWAEVLKAHDDAEKCCTRRHMRPDHKYAPGTPLSWERLCSSGKSIGALDNSISAMELFVDFERALVTLPIKQRRYYMIFLIYGYSCAEIAHMEGRDESTIREAIKAADNKIKNVFARHPRF